MPSTRWRTCVQDLVVRLELAPLVVMGHSWGGAIAVRYTAAHPENVTGLVLLDSGHIDYCDLPGVDVDRPASEWVDEVRARDGRLPEARGRAMHGLTARVSDAWPVIAEHRIPTLLVLATLPPHVDQNREHVGRFQEAVPQRRGAVGGERGPRHRRRRRPAARRRDRRLARGERRPSPEPDRSPARPVPWSDQVLPKCDKRSTGRPYTVRRGDDDERAARGVSALLRGARSSARARALADPARGGPDDALHHRRDAAVQAVLPAHEGAAERAASSASSRACARAGRTTTSTRSAAPTGTAPSSR